MPWTPQSFKSRHNKKLTPEQAKKAAGQANAILEKTGDEGLAISVANKQAKRKPLKAMRESRYGKDDKK